MMHHREQGGRWASVSTGCKDCVLAYSGVGGIHVSQVFEDRVRSFRLLLCRVVRIFDDISGMGLGFV